MMNLPAKAISTALCSATLLAPLVCAQVVKGAKPQGKTQPPAPAARQAASESRAPVQVKFGPPKITPRVFNPHAAQRDAAIIAVLQRQKQAAEIEAGQMKIGIRPSAPAATAGVQSQPASPANAADAGRTRATAPTNIQRTSKPGGVSPSRVSDVTGNVPSSQMQVHPIDTTALTCANNPSMRILGVSGSAAPATFTPEAKYNQYTIKGCSFGRSDPNNRNQAYIYGVNGFRQDFEIDFWSENGITVHLDPVRSAGLLDQDKITLVIAPVSRQPVQAQGYKFYAARGMPGPDGNPQEVPLKTVPQSNLSLSGTAIPFLTGYDQVPSKVASQFRWFWAFQGTPVSAWVFRYASGHGDMSSLRSAECFINDIGYNDSTCDNMWVGDHSVVYGPIYTHTDDVWNFSGMAPGFNVSSFQLFSDNPDPATMCGAWDELAGSKHSGLATNWKSDFTGANQISVGWGVSYCTDHEANFAGRNNVAVQSSYGLAAWVLGPRCVDPWTGQADENCRADLKKRLGM